jgi:hypothetical protein
MKRGESDGNARARPPVFAVARQVFGLSKDEVAFILDCA